MRMLRFALMLCSIPVIAIGQSVCERPGDYYFLTKDDRLTWIKTNIPAETGLLSPDVLAVLLWMPADDAQFDLVIVKLRNNNPEEEGARATLPKFSIVRVTIGPEDRAPSSRVSAETAVDSKSFSRMMRDIDTMVSTARFGVFSSAGMNREDELWLFIRPLSASGEMIGTGFKVGLIYNPERSTRAAELMHEVRQLIFSKGQVEKDSETPRK